MSGTAVAPAVVQRRLITEEDIEAARKKVEKKFKNKKKVHLKKIFAKLDADASGMLSLLEFSKLIVASLRTKVDKDMMSALWESAWDMRKHGSEDEMDVGTLAHWLNLDEDETS